MRRCETCVKARIYICLRVCWWRTCAMFLRWESGEVSPLFFQFQSTSLQMSVLILFILWETNTNMFQWPHLHRTLAFCESFREHLCQPLQVNCHAVTGAKLALGILSSLWQALWNIFHGKPSSPRSLADCPAPRVPFTRKSKSVLRRSASLIVQDLV